MRKGKGMIPSIKGRQVDWCRQENSAADAEEQCLSLPAHSHQSGHRNICFLVILANSSLGHDVALGSAQRFFCPVLIFRRFEA